MNKLVAILLIAITCFSRGYAQPRILRDFNDSWKFFLGDDSAASKVGYNDRSWRSLNLPHDWSIEGKFSEKNPSGFNEGALPVGVGWYRKTFILPSSYK